MWLTEVQPSSFDGHTCFGSSSPNGYRFSVSCSIYLGSPIDACVKGLRQLARKSVVWPTTVL